MRCLRFIDIASDEKPPRSPTENKNLLLGLACGVPVGVCVVRGTLTSSVLWARCLPPLTKHLPNVRLSTTFSGCPEAGALAHPMVQYWSKHPNYRMRHRPPGGCLSWCGVGHLPVNRDKSEWLLNGLATVMGASE